MRKCTGDKHTRMHFKFGKTKFHFLNLEPCCNFGGFKIVLLGRKEYDDL